MESGFLEELTMFGFYFVPSEDSCEVYRADVSIGAVTKLSKGDTKLTINDAFVRVLSYLHVI